MTERNTYAPLWVTWLLDELPGLLELDAAERIIAHHIVDAPTVLTAVVELVGYGAAHAEDAGALQDVLAAAVSAVVTRDNIPSSSVTPVAELLHSELSALIDLARHRVQDARGRKVAVPATVFTQHRTKQTGPVNGTNTAVLAVEHASRLRSFSHARMLLHATLTPRAARP